MPGLDFLIRAMDAGAIRGDDALNQLMGIIDAQKEKRQARAAAAQEAQSGLLSSLYSTASSAAQAGTPMDELRPLLDSLVTQAGMPASGMRYGQMPGIDALYKGGYSTVNPMVDDEDATTISNMVFNQVQNAGRTAEGIAAIPDPVAIRQKVHQQFAAAPNYAQLAPSIDEIIEEALKRAGV